MARHSKKLDTPGLRKKVNKFSNSQLLTSSFTVPNSGSKALKMYRKFPSLLVASLKSWRVISPTLKNTKNSSDGRVVRASASIAAVD